MALRIARSLARTVARPFAWIGSRIAQPVSWLRNALFGGTLSDSALIEFARSVRFYLTSGMTLRDAIRGLTERGSSSIRTVSASILTELEAGWSFQAALEKQGKRFPPLFTSLATVGEETGNLPEVLKNLESYYELRREQARQLRSQAILPVLQFIGAVGIVAGMIYILGQLPPLRVAGQVQQYDALGLGLIGTDGAIRFALYVFGGVLAAGILYWIVRKLTMRRAIVERFLLRMPLIGPALQATALTRFSFAMQLMTDSSLSILRVLRLAFGATDNPAFLAESAKAETMLRRGNSISESLASTNRFPKSYINSIAIAEESGHLPEMMQQHALEYGDFARRRLAVLNRIMATLVWLVVAGFVIWLIFRVFTQLYLGTVNKYAN
jgi:type II secretory pathway component PulF